MMNYHYTISSFNSMLDDALFMLACDTMFRFQNILRLLRFACELTKSSIQVPWCHDTTLEKRQETDKK